MGVAAEVAERDCTFLSPRDSDIEEETDDIKEFAADADSAERKHLKDIFLFGDLDGSGDLDPEELLAILNDLGQDFDKRDIENIFKAADKDQSGRIDCDEFVDFLFCLEGKEGSAGSATSFQRLKNQEYLDEAKFVEMQAVNESIQAELKTKLGQVTAVARKRTANEDKGKGAGEDDESYDLPMPCTAEGAASLMSNYVENGLKKPLKIEQVRELLKQFTNEYPKLYPNPVVDVDPPKGKGARFIVVGDTHGSLADVLCIFGRWGVPSASNVYLFNGDIADRGDAAVEIFLLVFAFFIAAPGSVIINRGNHENEGMNSLTAENGGGFLEEVTTKYGVEVYGLFVEAFKVLTLAVVVQKEYFVVHGGLTRAKTITLKFLRTLKHRTCTYPSIDQTEKEATNFCDLLWSDPIDEPGKFRSPRGMGIMFGPDVTNGFLEKNKLKGIIRSHQLPVDQRGVQIQHDGKCVTVFSASNYCGDAENYGAVLVFESNGSDKPIYTAHEHYAPPLDALRTIKDATKWGELGKEMGDSSELEKRRLEKELDKMAWLIVEKKPELLAAFVEKTSAHLIDVRTFEKVCVSVLGEQYPWLNAVKAWGLKNEDGQISVSQFFRNFTVELADNKLGDFKCQVITQLYEAILHADMTVQEMMGHFDLNGDGLVEPKELREILAKFPVDMTDTQLNAFVKSFFHDVSEMSCVDFLAHFTSIYSAAQEMLGGKTYSEPWMKEAYGVVSNLIFHSKAFPGVKEGGEKALKIFTSWDDNGDGILQLDEIQEGLWKLPGMSEATVDSKPLRKDMLMQLLKETDSSGDNQVNFLEFLVAFHAELEQDDASAMLAEQIVTTFYRHREAIRAGCKMIDNAEDATYTDGTIAKQDFRSVLESVKSQVQGCCTKVQLDLLVDASCNKETGRVNYEEFLDAFVLRSHVSDKT